MSPEQHAVLARTNMQALWFVGFWQLIAAKSLEQWAPVPPQRDPRTIIGG